MPISDRNAYKLMHYGTLALAEVEHNGIRVDIARFKTSMEAIASQIQQLKQELSQDPVWAMWKLRFGQNANMGSHQQLGTILYDVLGYKPSRYTETGFPATDEAALVAIAHPFVEKFLQKEKLTKLHSTYMQGIFAEIEGEFLHPSFSLNFTRTYRSSSRNPNFQNIPIRNKEVAKWIRSCFIPRPGRVLLEVDYGQIEVRVAACYHQDPTMLKYIEESYDMHYDMAKELFQLSDQQVTKEARHAAKNGFVFASFYGDYYKSIAANLWNMIGRNSINTSDGIDLYAHLKASGIKERGTCREDADSLPGTFEDHVRKVEDRFWNRRFPVYNQWRQDWWSAYCQTGGFRMLTGFYVHGILKRNQVINAPVQGCLRGDSKVLTKERGLVPIRELVDTHCNVWTGFRWATAFGVERGDWQAADIILESGKRILCDTRHKVKDKNHCWVSFSLLQPGDTVCLPLDPSQLDETFTERYNIDRIKQVIVHDYVAPTYTMTVHDPLHQFVADGVITKNSAFHCLLWSLITLLRELKKSKLKTLVVGQIHDSIVLDVPTHELVDVLPLLRKVMTEDIRKAWKWIITPLEIDATISTRNWYEKEAIKI